MPIRELPHRYREIGRLRLGVKNAKGHPERIDTWRITTPNQLAAERAAAIWGGKAEAWADAPTEGDQWQVTTDAKEIPVMIPPQDVRDAQFYEKWTAGGLERRCDGAFELRNGEACLCDPEARDCDIVTTLLVILPDLPDLGAWRIVTKGWYAATELPQTVEMLQAVVGPGHLPSAMLAIEGRTRKVDGKTMHFPVPVLRTVQTVAELRKGIANALPAPQATHVPGSAGVAAAGEPGPQSDPATSGTDDAGSDHLSDAGEVGRGGPTNPAPGPGSADATAAAAADADAVAAGTGDGTPIPEPAASDEPQQQMVADPHQVHDWVDWPERGAGWKRCAIAGCQAAYQEKPAAKSKQAPRSKAKTAS